MTVGLHVASVILHNFNRKCYVSRYFSVIPNTRQHENPSVGAGVPHGETTGNTCSMKIIYKQFLNKYVHFCGEGSVLQVTINDTHFQINNTTKRCG